MRILSDIQREALLKVIADAPDDLLLEAANNVKQYRLNIQRNFEDIKGFIGLKAPQIGSPVSKGLTINQKDIVTSSTSIVPPTLDAFKIALGESVDTTMTLPTIEEKKPNVEPSGDSAYKVGGATKAAILAMCKVPKSLEQINTALGRGKGKVLETGALLKRLWSLNDLFFDGEYYITKL